MIPIGYLRRTRIAALATALALLASSGGPIFAVDPYVEYMRFAADMARRGNWREAQFRWNKAAELAPDSPRVMNNLAVAAEALGDSERALQLYARAAERIGGESIVETNHQRAIRFWSQVRREGDGEVPQYNLTGAIPGDPEGLEKKKKGKSFKATVQLPVPARLDLGERRNLLVASFLTDESHLIDINRELVRFIRSEYGKHTDLEILPVSPAPAVPEQTLEDMIANVEFWKYLGGEYKADVIVSGIMEYDRRDSSGFRDVDVVSPSTGQKVRKSQFVEQEKFAYAVDIIFMDGATGELMFRDRLQRSAIYRGTQNDPITAFFELSDSVAPDLLAIIRPRTKDDIRFVFKK